MFIPIVVALLCITSNVYCSSSLIDYPYAERGLKCSELRADCTDFTKLCIYAYTKTPCSPNNALEKLYCYAGCTCTAGICLTPITPLATLCCAHALCVGCCTVALDLLRCDRKFEALQNNLTTWSTSPTQLIMED